MAVNVISTDSVNSFDYLFYPEQAGLDREYISTQLSRISNIPSAIADNFIAKTNELYERANNSSMIQSAKAALRSARGVFAPNTVSHLVTTEDLMSANTANQRFIMAEPTIRQLYNNQQCDGYSDSYVDIHPNTIKEDHYDYRRVMNGMVVETEDGWKSVNYYEELLDGDRELDIRERADILLTWETITAALSERKDPTSVYGGLIGG